MQSDAAVSLPDSENPVDTTMETKEGVNDGLVNGDESASREKIPDPVPPNISASKLLDSSVQDSQPISIKHVDCTPAEVVPSNGESEADLRERLNGLMNGLMNLVDWPPHLLKSYGLDGVEETSVRGLDTTPARPTLVASRAEELPVMKKRFSS